MGSEPIADILIVDDRASQRQALGAVVADLGARVVEAASGRDALRLLLHNQFAVILLDVNMPGMDGFETASLIRQRRRSEHTPIIFVTAYGDETHAARGYRLGAVDYIQAPVDSQVLRSKVAVFVELFRRTEEATRYAESLRRRAAQLRRLADLSMAVHESGSVAELLQTLAASAAAIVEAERVVAETTVDRGGAFARGDGGAIRHVARQPADWDVELPPANALFAESARVVRHGEAGLGWLAVPLRTRDGRITGVIHLSGKRSGDFDPEDEAVLLQVAQIGSIAIENTLFKDAQEANRLKDQFLATLSHELRTPLQAMLSWARILREDASDREVLEHGLDVIERSAAAQKQLIDDLLDVSRIVTGKLRLEPQSVSLAAPVQAALDEMRPVADTKGVHVGSFIDDGDLTVHGDPHRLKQVIGNLLSNAIKFTAKGGQVQVRLARHSDAVAEIRVVDSGEGIASGFLPHVFERFRQANSSSTRPHTGLGIGLAIVRHLVELHGGSVRAESPGEGQGATFIVQLPLCEQTPAVVERSATPLLLEGSTPDSLQGLRVLLVDDAEETRECVALMLTRRGAQVIGVKSADEALSALAAVAPHVLVSDIAMPGRDGISLIEEIRGDAGRARLPAAALSAYARPEERERALRAGFDVHLSKPVGEETLVASVLALSRLRARTP